MAVSRVKVMKKHAGMPPRGPLQQDTHSRGDMLIQSWKAILMGAQGKRT